MVQSPASPAPHLCAGGPSMMMLTHRICMALRGLGRLHTVDRVMRLKAEMLLRGTHTARSAVPAGRTRSPTALGAAGRDLRAQLKPDKVFDVMKNPLAFLHRVPARQGKVFMHKEGPLERCGHLR